MPWTCQLYEKELQAAGVMVTSGATTVLGGFVTEKEILKNQLKTVGSYSGGSSSESDLYEGLSGGCL